MALKVLLVAAVAGLASAASLPPSPPSPLPLVSNAGTAINFLFQNNLNTTDTANHAGALLLDAMPYSSAAAACAALHETLLPKATLTQHNDDFVAQLAYASNMNYAKGWAYFYDGGIVRVDEDQPLRFAKLGNDNTKLPVLCTQSAKGQAADLNKITVEANGNTYTGYRNVKSFRFMGIPYANFTERWTHSKLMNTKGVAYDATTPGPTCPQWGSGGTEYCLYLNIQTPYIPKAGSRSNLRPVHFWIHGGGFEGGSGSQYDGGDLSSREDIVTVSFNYRMGIAGFLAVPGVLKGNYGIGDQLQALDWTIKNIAKFGGDPDLITISGQSAGAGSARVLLGSPKAIGKFVGAILMSNLGGGHSLGIDSNYGTTYSDYLTIEQSYAIAGQNIFQHVGCNQTAVADQVKCLSSWKGDLSNFPVRARYVVQDGEIVVTPRLEVTKRNKNTAHVPIVLGIVPNDGASFNSYNTTCTSQVECLATDTAITQDWAHKVINSGLFPIYNTGNIAADTYNVSQRIVTDTMFRCVDEATAYAATKSNALKKVYYYESQRAYGETSYNPLNLDVYGPVTPGYPLGNPNLPYYKVHSGDLPFLFGGASHLRDMHDLHAQQLMMNYFANFMRKADPNPETWYLKARGYKEVLAAVQKTGRWNPVKDAQGPIALLDYPSKIQSGFVDVPQCKFLNYSLSYYFDGR
ncbi:hypothetical protein HDV00_010468 [Rhizophlyctis rosea]|nr:hypothetical protein HDV00_010468 [Rhizophlyctis rosea]